MGQGVPALSDPRSSATLALANPSRMPALASYCERRGPHRTRNEPPVAISWVVAFAVFADVRTLV
jgi:hypothetical protein